MAIYIPDADILIFEVVKTGSKWVRAAIEAAGIEHVHLGLLEHGGHGDLSVHGRSHRINACFVRSPFSWYRSYWAYRMEGGWRGFTLDSLCQESCYRGFVRKAVSLLPGFLGRVYERYAGSAADPIEFVGRQENLTEDLITLLKKADLKFNERAIRSLSPVNETKLRPPNFPGLAELIFFSEYYTLRRFDYIDGAHDACFLRDFEGRYEAEIPKLTRLAISTDMQHWPRDDAKEIAGNPISAGRRHARIMANFGLYAQHCLLDFPLAERFFYRAHEAEPKHPRAAGTLAVFLHNVRKDYSAAERLYRHAIDCNPLHAENLSNFGIFVATVRGNVSSAKSLLAKALELEPENSLVRQRYDSIMKIRSGRRKRLSEL